jgi:hypothetical protein
MEVVPEGGGDLEMDMTMVLDGHTTVEHALPIAPLHKDVIDLFARSKTSYTPTLLVAYGGFSGDQWFFQHYDVWKDEKLLKYVPQGNVDPRARIRSVMADDEDWHHIDVAASAKKVMEAGGTVCLGGHGQLQGLGPHWEMWAFVQGGMSPLQAIRVATINPAKTLGLDQDLGSIEAGKLADFVVLVTPPPPGPIARSVRQQADTLAKASTTYSTEMRSPVMFWTGVALVAGGAIADVGALTWAKESDPNLMDPGVRYAPCGTDHAVTRLLVAPCKANTGLLVLGSALAAGGGVLMVIGGQTVQIVHVGPRAFAARIRF